MFIASSGITNGVTINNNGLIDNYSNSNGFALYLTGKVEVKNSGTLRGNIYIPGQYGSLGNSGTIELSEHSTADINHFNNEGKLIIALKTDGTLTGTKYSKVGTNTAIFKNNSTIDVNVLSSSTNVALLAGSKLENVIFAGTNLTIAGKLNITDNSALLDFEYETTALNGEDSW